MSFNRLTRHGGWGCASYSHQDMKLLGSAEGDAVEDIDEQVVGNARACREGGLRQLRGRQAKGRIGGLHHTVDREMAAASGRRIVIEVVSESVVVGIARREQ